MKRFDLRKPALAELLWIRTTVSQESEPVTVSLKEGANALRFWRDEPPQYGLAIKSFTLKPAQ